MFHSPDFRGDNSKWWSPRLLQIHQYGALCPLQWCAHKCCLLASFPASQLNFPMTLLLLPGVSSLTNFYSMLVSDLLLGTKWRHSPKRRWYSTVFLLLYNKLPQSQRLKTSQSSNSFRGQESGIVGPLLRASQGQSSQAAHLECRALFHVPQAVGRIQLPTVVGLRSLFACWLLTRGCSLLGEAACHSLPHGPLQECISTTSKLSCSSAASWSSCDLRRSTLKISVLRSTNLGA